MNSSSVLPSLLLDFPNVYFIQFSKSYISHNWGKFDSFIPFCVMCELAAPGAADEVHLSLLLQIVDMLIFLFWTHFQIDQVFLVKVLSVA